MSTYYLDASALIKRYVTETGSSRIRDLFRPENGHLSTISRLTLVEVFSAFARRRREGSVTVTGYGTNVRAFRIDSVTYYRLIDLTTDVVDLSQQLLEQHPLRANAAVQLATALITNRSLTGAGLRGLVFLSADNRLNSAAQAEGLVFEDPNTKA